MKLTKPRITRIMLLFVIYVILVIRPW